MWRAIRPEARSGHMQQAIVEAILTMQNDGIAPPTVFFYEWHPSAVVLGTFQKVHDVCNVEECKRLGIDIVRRMSGGGAVFIPSGGCFTYSIIAPQGILHKDIRKSYEHVCGKVVDVLRKFKIPGEFRPVNDVFVNGRKISGTVQTQKGSSIMVGGTVLMDLDNETMKKVLIFDKEKLRAKGIVDPAHAITSVKEHSAVSKNELMEALAKEFSGNNFVWDSLTPGELELAAKLEKEKYATREWIFKR